MKILVTGGAGFIASHIVDAYIEAGHDVIVVDDLSVGKKENLNSEAIFYQVDITDQGALEKVIVEEKPEVINHHAAQKFLRRSVEFPQEDATINIIGSLNLLHLAQKHGVGRFIFASTAAVYGDAPEFAPYKEYFPGQPIAPYGVAKQSVESYMATYAINYGLKTLALRYANVYGPRQDAHGESGVIAIFTEKLLAGETPTINGTGEQTRDYVYIKDVIQANLKALQTKFVGALNVSTNTETSNLALYDHLLHFTGKNVEPIHAPAKKGDPMRLVLDNELIGERFQWKPKTELKDGLRETVEWFKNKK